MLPFASTSAAIAALLSAGTAPEKAAVPSAFSYPESTWTSPVVFSARPHTKGIIASAGAYYGEYKGRKVELSELLLKGEITPTISAWYGRQETLVKGRSRTSRFDVEADIFGVQWIFKAPEPGQEGLSYAVSFETIRPNTAVARTANAGATYPGTKNNSLALTASRPDGLDGRFSFTFIEGVNGEDASVLNLGLGRDYRLGGRLNARVQGHLVGQNITGSIDDVDFQVKPVIYAALGYRLAKGLHLESDLTYMPSGTPLAFGQLTSLTSFQIYRPSGPAAGLREDAFAVGALRLVGRFAF